MASQFVLSLDIGTSSVRAALYDTDANLIPKTSVKVERSLVATTAGGAVLDADEGFRQVAAAIDAVLKKAERIKGEIAWVASCSFWHSLVGVDAKRMPTTKVFGWADTQSRKYTDVLKNRFDEELVHSRTGAHFHSSFWPAKLLWLRSEFPDVWDRSSHWLSFSDFVAVKLWGENVTSISMASGSGVFNQRACEWDTDLLKYLKVPKAALSRINDDDRQTYRLAPNLRKRWPRLAAAQWFPTVADGAADNVGAGCLTKTKAALMVGTSGAMRISYAGEPPEKIPDGLWCYRVDRKRIVVGGALSDGGGLYKWLGDNLKLSKDAESAISRRGAAAHGITFLPFLAGERSTGYHEDASGAVLGLKASHDSTDVLQAAMESVAYRFAEIFDRLNSVTKIKEIVGSGGALRRSPVWTQIIADVLGRDVTMRPADESSSRGAVLLALESIGKIESIESLPTPSVSTTTFHPECHGLYKVARKRHEEIYNSILVPRQ